MNSLNVQQTVHLLPVPFETAEIINGYLFETTKDVMERRSIEYRKEENIFKIKQGWASRALSDSEIVENPETNEHWWFEPYGLLECQFQAVNCSVCGNYKESNTIDIESARFIHIKCYCSE
jgi:hypothetical protein